MQVIAEICKRELCFTAWQSLKLMFVVTLAVRNSSVKNEVKQKEGRKILAYSNEENVEIIINKCSDSLLNYKFAVSPSN